MTGAPVLALYPVPAEGLTTFNMGDVPLGPTWHNDDWVVRRAAVGMDALEGVPGPLALPVGVSVMLVMYVVGCRWMTTKNMLRVFARNPVEAVEVAATAGGVRMGCRAPVLELGRPSYEDLQGEPWPNLAEIRGASDRWLEESRAHWKGRWMANNNPAEESRLLAWVNAFSSEVMRRAQMRAQHERGIAETEERQDHKWPRWDPKNDQDGDTGAAG